MHNKFKLILILVSLTFCSFSQSELVVSYKLADSLYYSDPDSSYKISILNQSRSIKQNNDTLLLKSKIQIARYLILKSSLEEATIYLNDAMQLCLKANSLNDLGKVYNLKAILLKRLNKQTEAIELEKKAIEIYKRANNQKGVVQVLINLSLDYIDLTQYYEAQLVLEEVEKNTAVTNTDAYFIHQNKGEISLDLKHFDVAIIEFNKALKIASDNKMLDSQATILMEIGKAYRLMSNFDKAKDYLSQSEQLCVDNKMKHELVETYEEIILLYQDMGKYGLAYNFLKIQNDLKNEIVNVEKINKINELERKLALLQKEQEILKEKENTQKAETQSHRMLYVIVAIGLFSIVIVVLLYRTMKLKNQIQIKSLIIEEKQKEIIDSITYAKRIQQSILPSDKYIQRNLTRLKK
jgi:tetratricopeptide (TPR) repeat protein